MIYLLFAGVDYYPSGGARDIVARWQMDEEAASVARAEEFNIGADAYAEWMQLVAIDPDSDCERMVAEWHRSWHPDAWTPWERDK